MNWQCPECAASNQDSILKCACGYDKDGTIEQFGSVGHEGVVSQNALEGKIVQDRDESRVAPRPRNSELVNLPSSCKSRAIFLVGGLLCACGVQAGYYLPDIASYLALSSKSQLLRPILSMIGYLAVWSLYSAAAIGNSRPEVARQWRIFSKHMVRGFWFIYLPLILFTLKDSFSLGARPQNPDENIFLQNIGWYFAIASGITCGMAATSLYRGRFRGSFKSSELLQDAFNHVFRHSRHRLLWLPISMAIPVPLLVIMLRRDGYNRLGGALFVWALGAIVAAVGIYMPVRFVIDALGNEDLSKIDSTSNQAL